MKVGILATGNIANNMARTILGMKHPEVELYAVASRTQEKANDFAAKYGIKVAYGSYEELAQDKNVDLVYIATPHSEHYNNAMMCLKERKAVLVEKAFMANTKQAKEVLEYGKKQETLVAEAIWTRYMPSRAFIEEEIRAGSIGKVHSIQANLGYRVLNKERVKEPRLAGGVLLDVGVYPINFAMMFLGNDVKEVNGSCIKNENGMDLVDNMILTYANGKSASLHTTAFGPTDRSGMIYGEDGYIVVTNINDPEKIEVFDNDHKLIKTIDVPPQITGFEYQVMACHDALKNGLLECPQMPHQSIIAVMEVMDKLREQWGVKYPFEKN